MTVDARAIFVFSLLAVVGNSATHAAEPHNLVLFIPEALPAIVEEGSAPTLTRLRSEGVHFANSHSGFPRLEGEDLTDIAPDLRVLSLIDAASQEYATAFVYDERAAGEAKVGTELTRFLDTRLHDIKQSGRPFLFVYRLIEAKTSPTAAGDPVAGLRDVFRHCAVVESGAHDPRRAGPAPQLALALQVAQRHDFGRQRSVIISLARAAA